ncbi:MAG: WD40 domain-containing protein [Candidatus Hodarchaeales archaeon]
MLKLNFGIFIILFFIPIIIFLQSFCYFHPQTVEFSNKSRLSDSSFDSRFSINQQSISSFGSIIYNFTNHSANIWSIAFSPDGTTLASGSNDEKIIFWNLTSGDELDTVNAESGWVSSLAFSADNKVLVSGHGETNKINLWDVNSRELINDIEGANDVVRSVAFSPDDRFLVAGNYDGSIAMLGVENSIENAESLPNFIGHFNAQVNEVAFSPESKLLASAGSDNTIKLWNVSNQEEIINGTLTGHNDNVHSVVFSPDGKILASGSYDNTVILWNLTTLEAIETLEVHNDRVQSVTFSPDGTMLATASNDQTIKLWKVEPENITYLHTFIGHNSGCTIVRFSPDGTMLASASRDDIVIIWNIAQNSDDFDKDGISDTWEDQYDLDSSKFEDKFEDPDKDGLMNYMEYYIKTNPFNSDSDEDKMLDKWEYLYGNLASKKSLKNIDPLESQHSGVDSDYDSMPNLWEYENGLNPTVDDALKDNDQDALPNYIEYVLGTDPNDPNDSLDTDNDGMPNWWERKYGLNVKDPNDAFLDMEPDGLPNFYEFQHELHPQFDDSHYDKDEDGMINVWEYQMSLNASFNDALEDLDNDSLSNILEYQFGSWANQTDTDLDGMSDSYEWKMGLNATLDDSKDDKDEDGMWNLWEFDYGFNATDPKDAQLDYDGDGVSNVIECKNGTNPLDFWSVPPLSLSFVHLIAVFLLLILGLSGWSYNKFRTNKRKALIAQLNAPDFDTALSVQKAGYSDYSAFVLAKAEADTLTEMGTGSSYQEDYIKAVQNFEEALSIYERLGENQLIAEVVLKASRVQYDMRTLTTESSILRRFPKDRDLPAIIAIDHMIKALLAEKDENWGVAINYWQSAVKIVELDIEHQLICQGAILGIEFRSWVTKSTGSIQETFLKQLEQWQQLCEEHNLLANLCQAYLLRIRVALALFRLDEVEEWIEKCLDVAEKANLQRYLNIAQKERTIYLEHKKRIMSLIETEKALSPEEQEHLFQQYIKEALKSLEKEGLR